MTFDELCEAVRLYVESQPTEGGRGHRDDWRDQLDNTLTDIRAALSSAADLAKSEGRAA